MTQQFLNTGTQQRPFFLIHIEMAFQVEQGDLPDLAIDPFGLNQPMGVGAFTGGGAAGLGMPNEHARTLPQSRGADKGGSENNMVALRKMRTISYTNQ